MNVEMMEKEVRVRELLLTRLHEIPMEVSVPKVTRWVGLQPIPQDDYRVEYHGDARDILRRVSNSDQLLIGLRRRVRIEVDLNLRVAHVFLDPSNG